MAPAAQVGTAGMTVAASLSQLLVTWSDATNIFFRRFGVDGGAIDPAPAALTPGVNPFAAFDGTTFQIAFNDVAGSAQLIHVTADGGSAAALAICPGCPSQPQVAGIARAGDTTLVLLDDNPPAARISLISDTAGLVAVGAPVTGSAVSSVAGAAGGFLHAWVSTDAGLQWIVAERLELDAGSLDPGGFLVSAASADLSLEQVGPPVIAADDAGYWVVWCQLSPADNVDLFAQRVSLTGTRGAGPVAGAASQCSEGTPARAGAAGRLLLAYMRYDPAPGIGNVRVRARVLTPADAGAPCSQSTECACGVCGGGVCCGIDAGIQDGGTRDGGLDAGVPDGGANDGGVDDGGRDAGPQPVATRSLSVGCGCAGTDPTWAGVWLALALVLRRGRTRTRDPS